MSKQLQILGYTDKSKVRVRCFIAKGMPLDEQLKRGVAWRKDEKTIIPTPIEGWLDVASGTFIQLKKKRSADAVEKDSNGNPIWIEAKTCSNGIAYLRSLNAKGYGIYLIPNEGGGADADINRFPALFYECDGVSKDKQWEKLRSLEAAIGGLASSAIETRNSLHCYFALDYDGLLPSTWTQFQQRLIQAQDSDPAIWNPARLMRLAGFDHQRWNSETNSLEQFPVRLVQESDNIFALSEFDQILPKWDDERWGKSHQTSERVTTDPVDNPWDIRNFASHLDGYRIDGRPGWDTCKCPAHNGQSDDSLHIEQTSGAYKCQAGCDPKDVYRAALELAKSRGYQLPESRGEGYKASGLGGWMIKLKQRLAGAIKPKCWGVGRKCEIEVEQALVKNQPAVIYQNAGRDRTDNWAQALKRYKNVLDVSPTGTGKSFDAGMITPELFGSRQVIYVSSEHRNPSTPTLKNWADLEARHKGLTRDEFGKLRRAKPGQPYVVSPNCSRNDTISALRSKNIGGADTSTFICKNCSHLELCQVGAAYGYLYERAQSLKQPRLRAHPQSLPSPTEYDYSDVVLIWEEASEIVKSHRSINVTAYDVTRAIADLALASPELFDALRPVLTGLYPYLSGEMKLSYYGLKDEFIRTTLPKVDIDVDALRSHLSVDFDQLLNSTKEHGVDLADLPRNVRKLFADSDADLSEQVTKNLSLNWLPDFIDVLLGNVRGNLRISYNGALTITLPDSRLSEVAAASKGNIFLDATGNAQDLALTLGIERKEILTVFQVVPDTSNLEVIQVATMGRLGVGSDRSEFCQKRVDALISQIKVNTPGDVAVFDFKRHTADGDGKRRWWTDSRGVNDLENCTALVLGGVPCRNLGELEAEFSVLHGRSPQEGTKKVKCPVQIKGQPSPDLQPYFEMEVSIDDEFHEFCRRRILADIHQAIGRLRAHRRPGQKLQVYFIGDYPLDVAVTLRRASDITPEAATKVELVQMAIKGAVKQLRDAGLKITQTAIAQITGYSQQYISRFKVLLQTLLESLYSKSSKNNEPPTEDGGVEWVGQKYLPIIAESPTDQLLEEVLEVFESHGAAAWRQIWAKSPADSQVKILQALMFTLSAGELRSLCKAMEVIT
jgi:hypothetical protein